MKITSRQLKLSSAIILLTIILTWFYYEHETFPKPVRAATALLETPVAVASGLSYYLNLGVPVYDSQTAVISVNLIASIIIILIFDKAMKYFRKK